MSEIIRERGTPDALRRLLERLLESYTGAAVEIIEDPSQPLIFRVRVLPRAG